MVSYTTPASTWYISIMVETLQDPLWHPRFQKNSTMDLSRAQEGNNWKNSLSWEMIPIQREIAQKIYHLNAKQGIDETK